MNIKRFNGNDFPGDKWVRDILSRVNEIIDYLKLKVTWDRLAPAVQEAIEAEVELEDLADEVAEVLAPLTSVGTDGQVLTSDGTTAGWEDLPLVASTAYSLTIGGVISAPGQGSGASNVAAWSRYLDCMTLSFDYMQSAAGTAGSGIYLFPLPSGYTIKTARYTGTRNAATQVVGAASGRFGGGYYVGNVRVYDSSNLYVTLMSDTAAVFDVGSADFPLTGNPVAISFTANVWVNTP